MSDQSFHEIQLSGKQLVFLFMCAVVLAAVIFLFGVSVGRDVRGTASQMAQTTPAAAPANDAAAPAGAPPPPTQTASNELNYAQMLQARDGSDPAKVTPPTPPAETPPGPAPPDKTPAAAAAKTTAPPPATKEAPKAATQATKDAPKAPPALDGFVVQVEAFNTNDIAAKEVAKLKSKGYPAFVFTEPETTPGARFKVRVGPYAGKPEADQILKRLTKEGFHPLIRH